MASTTLSKFASFREPTLKEIEEAYEQALKDLNDYLRKLGAQSADGCLVTRAAAQVSQQIGQIKPLLNYTQTREIPELTKILIDTKVFLAQSKGEKTISPSNTTTDTYLATADKIGQRPWGNIIKNVAYAFTACLFLAGAIALAVKTFGAGSVLLPIAIKASISTVIAVVGLASVTMGGISVASANNDCQLFKAKKALADNMRTIGNAVNTSTPVPKSP